jgi:hypothetical protein
LFPGAALSLTNDKVEPVRDIDPATEIEDKPKLRTAMGLRDWGVSYGAGDITLKPYLGVLAI